MTKTRNAALLMAIALALAAKELQRRTGVSATDWRRELLEQAVDRFNRYSPAQLERYIQKNFTWEDRNV